MLYKKAIDRGLITIYLPENLTVKKIDNNTLLVFKKESEYKI